MSDLEDESYIAGDFYSLIGSAQLNELKQVELAYVAEREEAQQLTQEQNPGAMTLMQIAGLRSQKELDAVAEEKNAVEDKRLADAEVQRKEQENARLQNKFPPPDLKHGGYDS